MIAVAWWVFAAVIAAAMGRVTFTAAAALADRATAAWLRRHTQAEERA